MEEKLIKSLAWVLVENKGTGNQEVETEPGALSPQQEEATTDLARGQEEQTQEMTLDLGTSGPLVTLAKVVLVE